MEQVGMPPPPPKCTFPPAAHHKSGDDKDIMKKTVSHHLKSQQKQIQLPQTTEEEARELCKQLSKLSELRMQEEQSKLIWISYHEWKLTAVIQEGPQCGLVAISMVSEILCPEVIAPSQVLEEAIAKRYTKRGEMFSADMLFRLASSVLKCSGSVFEGDCSAKKTQVIEHLVQGHLVLIPYDRYHNNEPCMKNGKKAHWAVLSGLVIHTTTISDDLVLNQHLNQDEEDESLFHTRSPKDLEEFKVLSDFFKSNSQDAFVYANQGKSLRAQLWSLESLLKSNEQLLQLDPDIAKDMHNFELPSGGIQAGLRNKLIFLHS